MGGGGTCFFGVLRGGGGVEKNLKILQHLSIYRTSLVSGKFSPEMKTLDCVIFNAKQQELFAHY